MSSTNIRNNVQNAGFSSIQKLESGIAESLNSSSELNQLDLIKLQQKTAAYSNTISMMSGMLKSLSESDKEVIRNT